MGSRRVAAAGAVLLVCLVAAMAVNPAGQAHAAEVLAGKQEVSLEQLDASAVQLPTAQQAEAASATQPDAAVRLILRPHAVSRRHRSLLAEVKYDAWSGVS